MLCLLLRDWGVVPKPLSRRVDRNQGSLQVADRPSHVDPYRVCLPGVRPVNPRHGFTGRFLVKSRMASLHLAAIIKREFSTR